MRTLHGDAKRGKTNPLYQVWRRMATRCTNPAPRYSYWREKGIRVLWKTYEDFKSDMGPTYRPGLWIERKDNDGHYCKENCCWETPKSQARNRRNNSELECHGIIMCKSEWAEIFGLSPALLSWRIKAGWSLEMALSKPARQMVLKA